MGRYKPKRIVSLAVKEVSPVTSMIPTLKSALVPEILPKAIAKNNTVLKDEEVERAEIRNRVGLTYERLCRTVKDGMEAMVCNAETGEPICPANSERAKFIAAAIDLLGAKKAEQGSQRIPSILILLPNGDRLK